MWEFCQSPVIKSTAITKPISPAIKGHQRHQQNIWFHQRRCFRRARNIPYTIYCRLPRQPTPKHQRFTTGNHNRQTRRPTFTRQMTQQGPGIYFTLIGIKSRDNTVTFNRDNWPRFGNQQQASPIANRSMCSLAQPGRSFSRLSLCKIQFCRHAIDIAAEYADCPCRC